MGNGHSLAIEHDGYRGRVTLDGVDISSAVRGATWEAQVGERAQVTLDLLIHDVTTLSSTDADVLVSDQVADVLIALGWTRPEQ